MIKIAVDAMGGDGSPKKIIDGIILNHKNKKETFHVIHGEVELYLDGECFDLRSGDVQTISQSVKHRFFSRSGCVIEEISSTHDGLDSIYTDEQINDNESRKTLVNFWI